MVVYQTSQGKYFCLKCYSRMYEALNEVPRGNPEHSTRKKTARASSGRPEGLYQSVLWSYVFLCMSLLIW